MSNVFRFFPSQYLCSQETRSSIRTLLARRCPRSPLYRPARTGASALHFDPKFRELHRLPAAALGPWNPMPTPWHARRSMSVPVADCHVWLSPRLQLSSSTHEGAKNATAVLRPGRVRGPLGTSRGRICSARRASSFFCPPPSFAIFSEPALWVYVQGTQIEQISEIRFQCDYNTEDQKAQRGPDALQTRRGAWYRLVPRPIRPSDRLWAVPPK